MKPKSNEKAVGIVLDRELVDGVQEWIDGQTPFTPSKRQAYELIVRTFLENEGVLKPPKKRRK